MSRFFASVQRLLKLELESVAVIQLSSASHEVDVEVGFGGGDQKPHVINWLEVGLDGRSSEDAKRREGNDRRIERQRNTQT